MRIKKKHILESAEEINKAAELSVSSTEDLKNAFTNMGVEEPSAANLAADVVSSAIGDDEMNEEAVSDS